MLTMEWNGFSHSLFKSKLLTCGGIPVVHLTYRQVRSRYIALPEFHPLDVITFFQNHCVERMWVEINGRVNYPLKACLIEMQERNEINMDSEHVKFCVSWFTIRVSNVGTTLAVQAWNAHPIPGIYIFFGHQISI